MEIRNIRHKGLRNLVEKDNPKGLAPPYLPKIRAIMAFLIDMEDVEEIYNLQKFKPHLLGGDRAGTFSLSVTPNWRITFQYDEQADELFDVDYEDYH
ncbi:type II toxin-antitoxin system RelE/ParE family toxin [Parasphingorhabdus sp.]|uniref:type II toxin-antitoxin system RelE/ParE family toxin n=1 Tax=Parasphingorhabdus sp. TaxID=2709688 RepID=UPI002B2753CF|nr:type II toxin-antitoxin system RelE/ParE family toxin [Parasphingorhabdus sp.]